MDTADHGNPRSTEDDSDHAAHDHVEDGGKSDDKRDEETLAMVMVIGRYPGQSRGHFEIYALKVI